MAKKKSRSANVARKREKRKRRQKSKQRQLASEKQRKIQHSKLDEEGLFDLLMCSRDLILEPEFEDIYFDLDLTQTLTTNFFFVKENKGSLKTKDLEYVEFEDLDGEYDYIDGENLLNVFEDSEEFSDRFIEEVINKLITPEIIYALRNALSSCEKRFRRIGDRYKADAAFVSSSFFDAVPEDKYAQHPIFEGIMMKSLSITIGIPMGIDMLDLETIENFSDIIPTQTSDYSDEDFSSDYIQVIDDDMQSVDDVVDTGMIFGAMQTLFDSNQDMDAFTPPIDEYPAKALYKNCIGIELPELLQQWQESINSNGDSSIVNEPLQELDVYFTVSEDRLNIYAQSADELALVMENIEEHCESSIIFLAKTIDEGGSTDGPK